MKKFISMLISCILMFSLTCTAGAYRYSSSEDEDIHAYNSHLYAVKRSSAVKWDGKTALKENTYYYTTRTVTVSKDFSLPANSTLEVRKPLKITKNAELKILGELLVNYGGKVNPLSGTLTVAQEAYADCYGGISVSKNGILNVDGRVFVYEPGAFAAKGRVNVSESGKIACGGSYKEYSGCEVTGTVFKPTNITDSLSEKLSELSDSDKLRVNFLFYDSDTMRRTTIDDKSLLDIQLDIQNNYVIPYQIAKYMSNYYEDDLSYEQFKALLSQQTSPEFRYAQTNYGSAAGFEEFLSNPFFSNIKQNPSYAKENAAVPSDNKFLISRSYKKMFEKRYQLAEALNDEFLKQLSESLDIEELVARNPVINGFGRFSGIMSKSDIMNLSGDKRFMFLGEDKGKNYILGKDKINDFLDFYGVDHFFAEYGGVSVYKEIFPYDDLTSDNQYKTVEKYTDVTWNINYGTWYNTGYAGVERFRLFFEPGRGIYSFHGFFSDVEGIYRDVNLDFFCWYNLVGMPSIVYHAERVYSMEDLQALAEDDSVLFIDYEHLTVEE